MKILALDLGTDTGWAIEYDGTIYSGVQSFKNDRYSGGGMRYLKFDNWLNQMTDVVQVYFEEVRAHKGIDAAHVYGGFLAKLTSWCEKNSIPYEGVPVGVIKKSLTGKGNSNKEKMMEAVKEKGFNPTDHNEADAIAIMLHILKCYREV